MEERRKVPRHRTFKGGHIMFNRAGSIDCKVRNLSTAGACLEVQNQIGVPDDFTLWVDVDRVKLPCHVIWRAKKRMGVVFTAAA
jgi:hypothetical protein